MALLGIDLGTTNSACAVWTEDGPKLVPNRLGAYLTPSVVHIDKSHLSVGEVAKAQLYNRPKSTIANFKRHMGTQQRAKLENKQLSPAELSALILRSLKEDAEVFTGESIDEVIISVPAYFNDSQRLATKQAGELAGLKVKRLINEPTAAALAFGLHEKPEGHFLILDLGGGTFDVTLIEYFDGIMEVHASAGDNHLGGEDFLQALVKKALWQHELTPEKVDASELEKVRQVFEAAKRQTGPNYSQQLDFEIKGKSYQIDYNLDWFSTACSHLLLRAQRPIRQAINDAGLHPDKLDEVILVGGSSRLHPFKSMVTKLLGRLPSSQIDPDTAIALGTAVQAGLVAKDKALDDFVLTDVSPYTLGIDVINEDAPNKGSYFLPIIERNTTIPTSRVKTIYTAHDQQREIEVNIFQGENPYVRNNVHIGKLNAPVPPAPAGKEAIDVRLTHDSSGIIEADVHVHSSGKKVSVVIEQSANHLSESEVQKVISKIQSLKFHPRDTEANRELQARAEMAFSSALGEARDHIKDYIGHFQAALESQNERDIQTAKDNLEKVLKHFEEQEWT